MENTSQAERGSFSLPDAHEIANDVTDFGIRLASMSALRGPGQHNNLSFALSVSCEWLALDTNKVLLVSAIDVAVHSSVESDSKQQELAHLKLSYHSLYLFTKPVGTWPTPALESFLALNGTHHVWPYARAELQEMSVKIGLPPLILPVLKPGNLPRTFTLRPLEISPPNAAAQL